MKCDFRLRSSDLGVLIAILGICLIAPNVRALSGDTPYSAIVGRNVFGLKPPTINPPAPLVAAAAAATIKLQGISTILDRRQVLLKVKTAARPPEPAKEQSYLLSEGQGEDDIEVLAIDAVAGTVKVKNHDETLTLTMKDDAEKPAAGAVLPGPVVPSPQLPGLVPPPAGGGLPTPNNGNGAPRTIPTRTLRTSAADGAGPESAAASGWNSANRPTLQPSPQATLPNNANNAPLPYEAEMALVEVQRERTKDAVQAGRMPPLPPISFPQK